MRVRGCDDLGPGCALDGVVGATREVDLDGLGKGAVEEACGFVVFGVGYVWGGEGGDDAALAGGLGCDVF